jgi:hypothetical protein
MEESKNLPLKVRDKGERDFDAFRYDGFSADRTAISGVARIFLEIFIHCESDALMEPNAVVDRQRERAHEAGR